MPGDARAIRLSATRKGKTVLQEGRRRRVERLALAIDDLTDDDVAQMARAAALLEELSTRVSQRTD
jgi:DNA-binding MarR family transcriptional regulator